MDRGDNGAAIHFTAVGTGVEAFGPDTDSDFTNFTMTEFCPRLPATRTVNHFQSYIRSIVPGTPFVSGNLPEFIIITYSCNVCIAGGTVKSATRNKFFHTNGLINYIKIID